MFLNYGSLISHVCSGPPTSQAASRARFACKVTNSPEPPKHQNPQVCLTTQLSSFLEFQTHMRARHHTCEICFRPLGDQRALHDHCADHDQENFCLQCFVTFEKAESFRKHLAVKHKEEVVVCTKCRAPTWSHVYHFCLPDLPVMCQACHLTFPSASAYRVHQRSHTGLQPHACSCGKRFISKSLLWKHQVRRHPENAEAAASLAAKKLRRDCQRLGAQSTESVEVVQGVVSNWVAEVLDHLVPEEPEEPPPSPEKSPEKPAASALDAAIASIMPMDTDTATKAPAPAAPVAEIFPPPDRAAIQASIAERQYTPDTSWQAGLDALLAGAGAPVASSNSDSTASPEKAEKAVPSTAVMSGLWNQDLMFIPGPDKDKPAGDARPPAAPPTTSGLRTLQPTVTSPEAVAGAPSQETPPAAPLTRTQWDLDLSESSGDEMGPHTRRTPGLKQRTVSTLRPLLDHDYCYAAFLSSQQPSQPAAAPVQEMAEMDRILSNVAFGGFTETPATVAGKEKVAGGRTVEKKKKKKKKKKKRKKEQAVSNSKRSDSSSDTESDIDVGDSSGVDMFGIQARQKLVPGGTPATDRRGRGRPKKGQLAGTSGGKRGPKPKYHTGHAAAMAGGVMAGTARPSFDTDSSERGTDSETEQRRRKGSEKALVDVPSSSDTLGSSDLETDFSAEEEPSIAPIKVVRPAKVGVKANKPTTPKQPTLKLKIKLPPQPDKREVKGVKRQKTGKRRRSSGAEGGGSGEKDARPISKKMRESLALNSRAARPATSGSEEDAPEEAARPQVVPLPGTKLYCYCQCPHDEVSPHRCR